MSDKTHPDSKQSNVDNSVETEDDQRLCRGKLWRMKVQLRAELAKWKAKSEHTPAMDFERRAQSARWNATTEYPSIPAMDSERRTKSTNWITTAQHQPISAMNSEGRILSANFNATTEHQPKPTMDFERRPQLANWNATSDYQLMPVSSSKDLGHKRTREITDSDLMKNLRPDTKQQKGVNFNTDVASSSKAESLVSTPMRVSVIRHTRDVFPSISCPSENSNATPELRDTAEKGAQAKSSPNVCGEAGGIAGPSRFVRVLCSECFDSKSKFNRHSAIHSGDLFPCQYCNVAFSLKNNLTGHMMFHSKQKDYECDDCHQFFPRKDTIVIHPRIHTGERLCTCEKCGKSFSDPSHFKKHRKSCGSSSEAD